MALLCERGWIYLVSKLKYKKHTLYFGTQRVNILQLCTQSLINTYLTNEKT